MVDAAKEILEFRKGLVQKRSQLDLCRCTLLHGGLAETAEVLEMHEIDALLVIEPMRLHHKRLGDEQCVNPVSLGLANVVLARGRCLDRVQDANVESPGNEEFDKVIAVVSR